MEGEKETAEEEEEEEKQLHPPVDHQELPIIHWEDLSQRIAELEEQEQERRERSKGSRAEDGGESGGVVGRRLGGRGGRPEEVSSCCRHVTVPQPQEPAALLHQQQRQRRRGRWKQPKGCTGNRAPQLSCCWAETGSGHRSEDAERRAAGGAEGEGASGRQQHCHQAETSGALGAGREFRTSAQQLEGVTATGSARSQLGAGLSAAGSRPAEDQAGRHAAGRPGPDLTPRGATPSYHSPT